MSKLAAPRNTAAVGDRLKTKAVRTVTAATLPLAQTAGAARTIRVHNRSMQVIKTYSTRTEADLARIALHAEGIEAQVVGVGVAMEGGVASVRLLVPDDQAQAALEVLRDA